MKQIYKLLTILMLLSTVTLFADPPYATNVAISGLAVDGQILTGTYLYGDIDGDAEGTSTFKWYTASDAAGTGQAAIGGAVTATYTVQNSDIGSFIGFGVTPNNGADGNGSEVIVYTSSAVTANTVPTASAVNITGQLSYGATLTGSYTYSDAESDAEGVTTFQWYRSSTTSGPGAAIAGATSSTYSLTLTDVGQYISFGVTPVAATGTTTGAEAKSTFRGPIQNNMAPTASAVNISGNPNNGQTLTGNYSFDDAEGDAEGASVYQWYRADDASGTNDAAIAGANASTYVVVGGTDETKWLRFEVAPVAGTGTFTDGSYYTSPYAHVVNDPPTMNVPTIAGTLLAGQTLTATTSGYSDLDGDAAGVHTYQWYRSDNASGTGKIAIAGATALTYILTNDDVGKYVSFVVIPVAATGDSPGTSMESLLTGPILSYPLGIVTLTAPTNTAADQSLTPVLEWGVGGGTATENNYQVQVSTNSLFVTPVYDALVAYTGAAITHLYAGPALTNNTKYYWRVRSVENSGPETFYSPWSTIWSFTTVADITPSLSYPISSATVYTASPTLYWYNVAYVTGLTYDVEYKLSSAGGYTTAASGIGSTNFTLTNLSPGESYDWRITANKGALSEVSVVETFTVDNSVAGAAITPVPSFPIGGVAVYTLTPSMHWYLGTYASGLTYDVELATDNAFANIVYTASGISTLSTTATPLSPTTTYYWRVRSDNGSSTSSWSATSTFITTASASGSVVTPIPSWPVGGPMVYSTTPTLSWYLGTYAVGLTYNVDIATDAGFTSIVYSKTGITSLYDVVTTPLSEGTTYYWRVQSDNGSTQSSWSATNSFDVYSSSVSTGINTPILTYPVGGATLINTSPTLFWYCLGANSSYTYEVKYSLYPDLTSSTDLTGLTDNYTVLSGLSNGVTYYWSVRAYDGSNYSDWATKESFVTPPSTTSPIVVPNPGTPAAGVTVDSSPQLTWFLPTATSAVTYDLQVSTDLNFVDNTAEIKNISASSTTLNELEAGKTYFWRVRTRDAEGTVSYYSQSAQFAVNQVTDVEKLDQIPTEFDVAQNYPNPFNPETTIRYSVPEASFVTVKVYNTLGQEVKTLVNNDVSSGVYNVRWNGVDNFGSKVASGTYIYRVTAGSKVFTKKMILLK